MGRYHSTWVHRARTIHRSSKEDPSSFCFYPRQWPLAAWVDDWGVINTATGTAGPNSQTRHQTSVDQANNNAGLVSFLSRAKLWAIPQRSYKQELTMSPEP